MSANSELLNYINENACIRCKSFKSLSKIAAGDEMRKFLDRQTTKYEKLKNELKKYKKVLGDVRKLPTIKPYGKITINTIWSVTKDYVSGGLIKNSNIGVKEIKEKLDEYKDADRIILELAKKLLKIEEENLDELRDI